MSDLGWHVISGERLLELLRRVVAGEDPDLVYAEEWANAEHEHIEGNKPSPMPRHATNAEWRAWAEKALHPAEAAHFLHALDYAEKHGGPDLSSLRSEQGDTT